MLTPDQIQEIVRLIQDHIKEERERMAKAAGMAAGISEADAIAAGNELPQEIMADFSDRVREGK